MFNMCGWGHLRFGCGGLFNIGAISRNICSFKYFFQNENLEFFEFFRENFLNPSKQFREIFVQIKSKFKSSQKKAQKSYLFIYSKLFASFPHFHLIFQNDFSTPPLNKKMQNHQEQRKSEQHNFP